MRKHAMFKRIVGFFLLWVVFVGLNILGLYFGDGPTPDVDGKYHGFTKEEHIKMWKEYIKDESKLDNKSK